MYIQNFLGRNSYYGERIRVQTYNSVVHIRCKIEKYKKRRKYFPVAHSNRCTQ